MPYAQKTLLDCQQSLADRHDKGTLPTSSATLAFYTRWLNKGQAYCADRLRLSKPSAALTTVSGSVALPDDFLVANRVFNDDDVELSMVGADDVLNQQALTYWITGNQTDGFTLNVHDDDIFTVHYSFKPTEMVTAATDVCIIPDPEAVVAYAYSFIRKGESDPFEDADAALQECDSRLAEIQSAKSINENFTGFSIY